MSACQVCGKPAGTGGDRYKSRPAKYCSYVCRSLANNRRKNGVPKRVQEIERLRALLDAHDIDWREGAIADAAADLRARADVISKEQQ